MNYWLLKSEPDVYSFAQLLKDKQTHWNGVRNYQAANNLKAMVKNDLAFFYHSNVGKEIVGICKIVKTAYPDPSDESGKFVMVDVAPMKLLKNPVTLIDIKADKNLQSIALIKQSRLSVMPITADEWNVVMRLSGTTL
jgi:predicted RNA-binding protein with PUA-like domain